MITTLIRVLLSSQSKGFPTYSTGVGGGGGKEMKRAGMVLSKFEISS